MKTSVEFKSYSYEEELLNSADFRMLWQLSAEMSPVGIAELFYGAGQPEYGHAS